MDKNQILLDGQVFTVAELDPWITFPMQMRIWPAVAEVIGAALSGMKGIEKPEDLLEIDLSQIDPVVFTTAIGRICKILPAPELEALTNVLLNFSTGVINGRAIQVIDNGRLNIAMKGRTIDTWKLLFHSVRVNYPDFFARLGAKEGAPKAENPSAT